MKYKKKKVKEILIKMATWWHPVKSFLAKSEMKYKKKEVKERLIKIATWQLKCVINKVEYISTLQ
jgi:hypothetical protein